MHTVVPLAIGSAYFFSILKKTFFMRFIDPKTHGYLDYLVGIILIIAPWVLNFDRGGAETWVPVTFGALVIIYSLLTDYELGASRRIPMRMHLLFDLVGGIVLAI